MFTVPTPSPANLGAEERPVRAALSSELEKAIPDPFHPEAKQDWYSLLCPHTSVFLQPCCKIRGAKGVHVGPPACWPRDLGQHLKASISSPINWTLVPTSQSCEG